MIPRTFTAAGEFTMGKSKIATPAKERTGSRFGKVVAKGKEIGKNVAAKTKAAGTRAAAHVSRHKAAYIAGGLGAAGVAGVAAASRKRRAESEN